MIERRRIGRKIYIYEVTIINGKKKRRLVAKKTDTTYLLIELKQLLNEAEKDREALKKVLNYIIEWLPQAVQKL